MNQAAPIGQNVPEFTVTEISGAIKRTLESDFGHVRVRGELSQVKRHSSGHLYATLKDEKAGLAAVCWRGTVGRLTIRPEDGMEVIATGRISSFAGQSKYQIVIDQLELAGEGALLKLLEERKKRLAAEGLFDPERKHRLPYLPRRIGVITSPTGAVIRDILHRLDDRFPTPVLIWPVPVQGEGAAEKIAAAIAGMNALPDPPEVLIVARGGGGLEDLMPFNEEVVVRAAAESNIPLISAVGHETDTTLIDFAADRRAPTPTAAAEMAVPVRYELLDTVGEIARRLTGAMARRVDRDRMAVSGLARGLGTPERRIESAWQAFDDRAERLGRAMMQRRLRDGERLAGLTGRLSIRALVHQAEMARERLNDRVGRAEQAATRRLAEGQTRLETLSRLLDTVSYRKTLERGFVLVRKREGDAAMRSADLEHGASVRLEFADGERQAILDGGVKPLTDRRRVSDEPDQGKLF